MLIRIVMYWFITICTIRIILLNPLFTYLCARDESVSNVVLRECGDYLSIVDTSLLSDATDEDKLRSSYLDTSLELVLYRYVNRRHNTIHHLSFKLDLLILINNR